MITKAEKIGLVRKLMGGWERIDVVEYFECPDDVDGRVIFTITEDYQHPTTFGVFLKCLHLGMIDLYYNPDNNNIKLQANRFEFIISKEYKELLMVYYI